MSAPPAPSRRAKTKAPDTSDEAPTFLNQLTEQGARINHFPFSLISFKQTDHEIVPKWGRKQSLHQYIAQSNAYIGEILTINIKIFSN